MTNRRRLAAGFLVTACAFGWLATLGAQTRQRSMYVSAVNEAGTPVPDDDLKALAARYLFRVKGAWFVGAQGTATNYQGG